MSFLTMLYSLFLMPIQLVFEVIFSYAYRIAGERPGLAIIALSLAINLLVLPLYRRADTMQDEERKIEAKLHDGVSHIKKAFRGAERTMILQTYYRQNNYSPLYVLRSAVSLLLEIPFFIAAYRFLSGLELLNGVSFGPVTDLGKPDGLIVIGGLTINLLPILMTAVNVVSTVIFTREYPLKTKIQLYAMAAFFLVFLYDSPSGLVFYWTLNNVFSLIKTVFYKIKNPRKVLKNLLAIIGCGIIAFGIFDFFQHASIKRLALFAIVGLLLAIPFLFGKIKTKTDFRLPIIKAKPDKKLFIFGAVFLTILNGILIPSAVVSSSPQEFIIIGSNIHPIWYVVNSFLVSAGAFILWFGVFYWLFSPKIKVVFERLLLVLCGVGTVNYLFFGNDFGTISSELIYDNGIQYSNAQILINALVIIAVSAIVLLITIKKASIIKGVILAGIITTVIMSVVNSVGFFSSVAEINLTSSSLTDSQPNITLSKTEKNVVVFMLDRAMGEYIPFIMSEHPELEEKFSGFTYYSNVISFGGHTNFGTPPLFGGYEYTPVEMNKRDTESLESKHNEALKVMPVLFDKAGYDVTVCDPPYAGYKQIPDLSIYDDYPEIKTYITQGTISKGFNDQLLQNRLHNFFCYSIVKTSPAIIQSSLYNEGHYHRFDTYVSPFFKSYEVLKSLSKITYAQEKENGSFVMINNDSAHNSAYIEDFNNLELGDAIISKDQSSLFYNNMSLDLSQDNQLGGYNATTLAFLQLGNWFDYLREQGVYDNTRIILVADHGWNLNQLEELIISEDDNQGFDLDIERFFPLLMVKEFNSTKYQTSDEFMTNADVPILATNSLIESPQNPFTKNEINNNDKFLNDQIIIGSGEYQISVNNGNTFLPSKWYSSHDSIWNKNNWRLIAEDTVLKE